MSRFRLEIRVTPRPGLLDPEGKAIQHALHSLDYEQVRDVRVGKLLYVNVEAASSEEAREGAEAMCRRLLANPVTEDFEIDVREAAEESMPA
ncbi:MAG: phosphoribosylformylglycinamidine synthase subunit PurS [Gemmatimonadetes bacterium]|nr:phosphoribosylformylglycinamidine synthase subunit PurS [Gemmatimonadota bacterium]MCH8810509.1 phosphoribosylformylglycinamidine synthase subunit PurS [Gemmatimonadota bacterium]